MKVLLALHGYPPELQGGTEGAVQALARGLAARGHAVIVAAGSLDHGPTFRVSEETQDDGVRVVRFHRSDLYFDHWQKSYDADVSEAFQALCARERPDVVHVHHWIRMSRDLVACAARAGVPAVVTLHDFWPTCLIAFRVRPDTHAACDVELAPDPCLDCAALVPPRTPWMPREAQAIALYARRGDLAAELALAREVLAPTRTHAEAVARFLGLGDAAFTPTVVPNGRDLALPRREPARSDALELATWGHLHPLKGVDLVIEALARASREARRPLRLHVAGGEVLPEHTARLKELARGLDVVFHGPYAVSDLATHPAGGASVMVSGSRARESFSLVVDEAAALGLAMVLPRAGAFLERLREGEGCLFYEQGDVASLAAALARLASDPALVARLRASVPPAERLAPSIDRHVEAVLAAYARAVAAGPPLARALGWWEHRLRREETAQWDRSLSSRSPEELGLA